MERILMVEDNDELRIAVLNQLAKEYHTVGVSSIADAKKELNRTKFDLILLDSSLPDGDGSRLCAYMQDSEQLRGIPVLFVSGKDTVDDKVLAFSVGADDYVVKPFNQRELRARIQSKLKKNGRSKEQDQFVVCGEIKLNIQSQLAFISTQGSEKRIDLTPHEFIILVYFMKNGDHVLTRDQIINAAWGEDINIFDRTIDRHISSIRKKLGTTSYTILTRMGVGYVFSKLEQNDLKQKAA